MIQNSHGIDSHETHVFTDGEGKMSHVILVMEDKILLEIGNGEFYTVWVGEAVLRAREDGDWEIQERQVVIWCSSVTVLLEILFWTIIPSFEIWFTSSNNLSIMNKVSISSSRWEIGHIHIFSMCVVNSWIQISK